MKNLFTILLAIFTAIVLLIVIYYYFSSRGNPNALWEIVSQKCVPDQEKSQNPAPCLKVDLTQKYVLFKDAKGPLHDLVMPTYHVTGIESPELEKNDVPPFFALAWNERSRLSAELGKPIDDAYLALAVNSEHSRSQNQLHIHLACLRPDVYRTLETEEPNIRSAWAPLKSKINGHEYLAVRLKSGDLTKEDPFKLLNIYASGQEDEIGNYGLAVAASKDGGMVLLANRFNPVQLAFGSAGEIQDYSCELANKGAASAE
ncbi:CDP-diacylglycerol diphosphatase [Phyllobacterium salinisoli]|uniref:CDP-diacylglycerol pyrophosphatase n=1 Tax=Phyllobacterium salinisoli TaxID=1899321 RepID=A0A368K0R7_9HYPH|nr:CDP-diacylglycerol diphosphatase [Phyllobacterium salinisoli]RCS22764.1 CDP-diacylglycerol diphosphatase [Phyllobacterium salinisoli]